MADIGPVFSLSYPVRDGCGNCFDFMDEGDSARYVDGEIWCVECSVALIVSEESVLEQQIKNSKNRKKDIGNG